MSVWVFLHFCILCILCIRTFVHFVHSNVCAFVHLSTCPFAIAIECVLPLASVCRKRTCKLPFNEHPVSLLDLSILCRDSVSFGSVTEDIGPIIGIVIVVAVLVVRMNGVTAYRVFAFAQQHSHCFFFFFFVAFGCIDMGFLAGQMAAGIIVSVKQKERRAKALIKPPSAKYVVWFYFA